MKFSLVIPCYNEEKIYHFYLESIESFYPIKNELILVNNGSTDRQTINKISKKKILLEFQ